MLRLGQGYPIDEHPRSQHDIAIDDRHRLKSIYCIGDSGSGKTRIAESWIMQDINAVRGFGLLDNQGWAYRRTIAHLLHAFIDPQHPIKDQLERLSSLVVLVEPVATDSRIPLNVLASHPGYHPHTITEQTLFAFRSAWADSWGPRLEDILRNCLALLQEHNLTLMELPKLLMNDDYRAMLAERSEHPILRQFFLEHLEGITKKEYRYWIESTRNKANEFVSNPYLVPMVSHDDCFDFQQAMDLGQIVLIYLPKRHLHDSGSLMGKLILSRLFIAALNRDEWDPELKNWYLYVDEFQDFATSTMLDMVTQTRKRGIGLHLFHQNMLQPPFDKDHGFLETVLSNCHTHVYFRLSHRDAQRLAPEMFTATGDKVKRRRRHWLWGEYGEPRFWTVQEEWQHYYAELENQQPKECYVQLKGAPDPRPYISQAFHVDDSWNVSSSLIDQFREINFATWGTPIEKVREMARNRAQRVEKPREAIRDEGHPINAVENDSGPQDESEKEDAE